MRIDERAVLIRITRSYRPGLQGDGLYEATRKWWVLNPRRDPDVAFAVHRGRVLAVYTVDDWKRDHDSKRWAFRGRPDPTLAAKYVGADIAEYFRRGAANPIRYVNC